MASLKINKNIPHFKPSWTFNLWSPRIAPSREISRHHKKENTNNIKILTIKKDTFLNLNIKTTLEVNPKAENPLIIGQGL